MTTAPTLKSLRAAFGMEFDLFIYISLKNRYLYVQTPKVASTTIKYRLHKLESEGTQINPDTLPLHPTIRDTIHIKPFQLPDNVLTEVFDDEKFFRFCFVRNPYVRVLSCYLDKIKGKEPESVGIYNALNVPFQTDEVSFEYFIEYLESDVDNIQKWNPHWRPMHFLLRPDLIDYSLIGKLENFDSDFMMLQKRLEGRLDESSTRAPHKTASNDKTDLYYTKHLQKRVENIYWMDFESFNY